MPHHHDTVRRHLADARQALEASNAPQALQCVIQALKLLHGDGAVLPALQAAAEHYHAQQTAPVEELARLLAQVSVAADQGPVVPPIPQQQQQQQQHLDQSMHLQAAPPWHPHTASSAGQQLQHSLHQPHLQQPHIQDHVHLQPTGQQTTFMLTDLSIQQQRQQHQQPSGCWRRQHEQCQQVTEPWANGDYSTPILEETGRGSLTTAAMADGSSWRCPYCSGVLPVQRQQAHLANWCPSLHAQGS